MFRCYGACTALALVVSSIFMTGCPYNPLPDVNLPQPKFEAEPSTGDPPLAVQFTDESVPGAAPIESWLWQFGDGTTSTEPNPEHVYYTPEDYTVSLTVTTAIGTKTREIERFVRVAAPTVVASVGVSGAEVDASGATLAVPQGAFSKAVVVGIAPGDGDVDVDTNAGDCVVSRVYTITHDQDALVVDPAATLTLSLPFSTTEVPADGLLCIMAAVADGPTVMIPGEPDGGVFEAEVKGLPPEAAYAVVYSPNFVSEQFSVPESAKAAMGFDWAADQWQFTYTQEALQALTALRLGSLADTYPYGRRDYSQPYLDETLTMVRDTVGFIQTSLSEAGFRGPALNVSDNSFGLILADMGDGTLAEDGGVNAYTFGTAIFGSIAIDAEPLIALAELVAEGGSDQEDEIDFANAFTQQIFHAVFRGYDLPALTAVSDSDVNLDGDPAQVAFYQGLEDGLALYFGQILGGVDAPRSLMPNEYSELSIPLLSPASPWISGYSASAQDFFFFVRNRYADADSVSYVADPYEGILEVTRLNTADDDPAEDYDEGLSGVYAACDTAFQQVFSVSLAQAYWAFVRNRLFEKSAESLLRPSDQESPRFEFDESAINSDAVIRYTFEQDAETVELTPDEVPLLQDIPPMTTRAVVLDAQGVTGDVTVTVNAYEWYADGDGNSVKVKVYRNGYNGDELTAEDARVKLEGIGEGGLTGFDYATVLLSNVSTERSFDVALHIRKSKPGAVEQATGILGGQVSDASTGSTIADVTVVARDVDGNTLDSMDTNPDGLFGFADLPVGDVQLTFTKAGYATKKVDATVVPDEITVVMVEMSAS